MPDRTLTQNKPSMLPTGTRLGKRRRKTTTWLTILVMAHFCTASRAAEGEQPFVFRPGHVAWGGEPDQRLDIRETITLLDMTSRLSGYSLRLTMECDGFCILVEGTRGSLEVYYNQDAKRIERVISRSESAKDASGNKVGSPLARALGRSFAKCEVGESTVCKSLTSDEIAYVVRDSGSACTLTPRGNSMYNIPACAKIDGIVLQRATAR